MLGFQLQGAPPTTNQPPVTKCKNIVVAADTNCQGDGSVDNGSFDPDGDPITLTQLPAGPYPLGTNAVTLTVTDSHGASSSCSATVTVVDMTPPFIVCPTNIVQGNDPGQCSAVVDYAVTAGDNCSGVSLVMSPASGSTFPKGTTTVTCTAADWAGNSASCTFTVTVEDREAPRVACRPAPNPSAKKIPMGGKNPSSGENPDGYYQLLAADNCDPNPLLYVHDHDSGFVAGPFRNGDIVKLRQNPGGTPGSDPDNPPITAQIHLNGDGSLYAVDASGNVSPNPCLMLLPPGPK
jgi:hypothetical protein